MIYLFFNTNESNQGRLIQNNRKDIKKSLIIDPQSVECNAFEFLITILSIVPNPGRRLEELPSRNIV